MDGSIDTGRSQVIYNDYSIPPLIQTLKEIRQEFSQQVFLNALKSVIDLATSIPHQLVDVGSGMLTGTDEDVALELVTPTKEALVDSGLLFKDFGPLRIFQIEENIYADVLLVQQSLTPF